MTRINLAESLAKEANRLSITFSSYFVSTLSPNMPPDSGSAMAEIAKAHLTLMSEKKKEAQEENDLIYNAVCPSESALAPVEKLAVAKPIPIQEVYGAPEVQKVIGPDLFSKLVPLSVHESASVYSEEKAKLVRGEVEKAEIADGEARVAMESMGLPAGLRKWREIASGEEDIGVPREVEKWGDEIQRADGIPGVERMLGELDGLKRKVDEELQRITQDLDNESRECEGLRVSLMT